MAEAIPTPRSSPDGLLDVLNKHLTILNSHVQFLHTFSQTLNSEPRTTPHKSTRTADDIEQMILQATNAIRNTERCSKLYLIKPPSTTTETGAHSPKTTLAHRTKRPFLPSTEEDDKDKPAKRRRSSRVYRNADETWHDAAEHITATSASTSGIPPTSATDGHQAPYHHVEYDDITAEVEARLLAREQRRKLREQQSDPSSATIKRKRRSTLGDSIQGSVPEDDVNGTLKSDRNRRISAGGTRQIKKLKTRKSNEGSRKSVLPLKSVKLPVEVDVAGQKEKEKEKEIAKKRRRSSFVRGQASEVVANKFETDDRSTKRRKR